MTTGFGVRLCVWLCCINVLLAPHVRGQGAPVERVQRGGREALFQISGDRFRALAAAHQVIPARQAQSELLAAAVFHETNRRRARHRLPALKPHPTVRAAAGIHARAMARGGWVGHENPREARIRTLQDRLGVVGLKPAYAAENVALTFVLRYESGTPVYVREESGKTIFSIEPDGKPIERHTYQGFAVSLVDQWMNSPGHRKNILSETATHLGSSVKAATGESGMPVAYAVQVFFKPLEAR